MDRNDSYLELHRPLAEVTSDLLNLNVTESGVDTVGFIDFYEVCRTESSQLIAYRSVVYVFGTLIFLSNLTVVISSGLILTKGQQPKSTYVLLGNVSLADMISGISIILHVGIENPVSTNMLCVFQMGMLVCPAMVSIFSVGLIAVDRYIYILHGLHYQRWFSTTKVRISILLIWMIAIVLGFLPATGWVNNEPKLARCYYISLFPGALIVLNSLLSIVPIIVVVILYSIILVRALRNVKEIKASVKAVKCSTHKKPEMRIYRGNGNLGKNAQSVKSLPKSTPIKIKRSFSFNAVYDNKDGNKDCAMFAQKSKSDDDIINTNDPSRFGDVEKVKSKKRVNFVSKVSVCSQTSTRSVPNISVDFDVNTNVPPDVPQRNPKKKFKSKEPSKYRAITVVLLTTCSFIVTWMPFFITVIYFVFYEEKLTDPSRKKIRMLLAGPLPMLAFLNSLLNPLIYAWWHKGFKRSLKLYFRRYILRYVVKNTNR